MRKRSGASHLQTSVAIRHGTGVLQLQNLVLDFRFKVMQVGLQRSALLLVVNFSVRQQDVLNSKVENIHGLVILRRDLGLRDIAAAIVIADEMNYGMLNDDFAE